MRLIDADALEKLHCEDCSAVTRGMCEADPICASLMWVREAPTIDAVEVVRCKDCKYYILHALVCRHEHMNGVMPIDGYCSNGKRRPHHDSLCDQTEEGEHG